MHSRKCSTELALNANTWHTYDKVLLSSLLFIYRFTERDGRKGPPAENIARCNRTNTPHSKGVCLKTLCDASTRVMVAAESVEGNAKQILKRYAEEG
jgi:hypothetical protein